MCACVYSLVFVSVCMLHTVYIGVLGIYRMVQPEVLTEQLQVRDGYFAFLVAPFSNQPVGIHARHCVHRDQLLREEECVQHRHHVIILQHRKIYSASYTVFDKDPFFL